MKIWKGAVILAAIMLTFTQCSKDDEPSLLPVEEQNVIDDLAIGKYLQEHYFDSDGRVTRFDESSEADDSETPLSQLAEQHGEFYVVKNPAVNAEGRAVVSNLQDSILIQYSLLGFRASRTNDTIRYGEPSTYYSTVHQSGYAQWDPTFYYVPRTSSVRPEQYEIPAIVEGLKHFNSTGRGPLENPPVRFQGIIIAPSRAVFGRNTNQMSIPFDVSMVLNFELLQVVDRDSVN
ncbi:MAG: hypothetical protein Q4F57_02355 [Weeksellaceae bacterium]|nr:hypothetical protein [Weeksellaceae bacterium]